MEGYIKLHRQIMDSWVFTDPISLKIWVWLLSKSSIQNQVVSLKIGKGFTNISIERGQLIFGRNAASEVLDIPAKTIERHLLKFQNDGMIIKKSTNQYSVITICKYDTYQGEKNNVTSQRPTNGQPMGIPTATYKKDKNISKDIDADILNGIIETVVEYLNKKTGRTFDTKTEETRKLIAARVKEKRVVKDFFAVIDIKFSQWGSDPKMKLFLQPSTLFSGKFSRYLEESEAKIVGLNPEPKKPHHYLSVAN